MSLVHRFVAAMLKLELQSSVGASSPDARVNAGKPGGNAPAPVDAPQIGFMRRWEAAKTDKARLLICEEAEQAYREAAFSPKRVDIATVEGRREIGQRDGSAKDVASLFGVSVATVYNCRNLIAESGKSSS